MFPEHITENISLKTVIIGRVGSIVNLCHKHKESFETSQCKIKGKYLDF